MIPPPFASLPPTAAAPSPDLDLGLSRGARVISSLGSAALTTSGVAAVLRVSLFIVCLPHGKARARLASVRRTVGGLEQCLALSKYLPSG